MKKNIWTINPRQALRISRNGVDTYITFRFKSRVDGQPWISFRSKSRLLGVSHLQKTEDNSRRGHRVELNVGHKLIIGHAGKIIRSNECPVATTFNIKGGFVPALDSPRYLPLQPYDDPICNAYANLCRAYLREEELDDTSLQRVVDELSRIDDLDNKERERLFSEINRGLYMQAIATIYDYNDDVVNQINGSLERNAHLVELKGTTA